MREPDDRAGISRRGLLIGVGLAGVGIGAAGFGAGPFLRDDWAPELDESAPTGILGEEEMATLLALVEVLIPPRHRAEPADSRIVIDAATSSVAGVLDEYRRGARLLQEASQSSYGTRFESLPLGRRERVVDGMLWRYAAESPSGDLADQLIKVQRRLERLRYDEPSRRFRQLVVRDLLHRFYLDRAVALIGYSNIPGVAGDPRAYVNAPGR